MTSQIEEAASYCGECGGYIHPLDERCIECGTPLDWDRQEPFDPEYEEWLEGGEIKGDQEREDGTYSERWKPIQEDD